MDIRDNKLPQTARGLNLTQQTELKDYEGSDGPDSKKSTLFMHSHRLQVQRTNGSKGLLLISSSAETMSTSDRPQ